MVFPTLGGTTSHLWWGLEEKPGIWFKAKYGEFSPYTVSEGALRKVHDTEHTDENIG